MHIHTHTHTSKGICLAVSKQYDVMIQVTDLLCTVYGLGCRNMSVAEEIPVGVVCSFLFLDSPNSWLTQKQRGGAWEEHPK